MDCFLDIKQFGNVIYGLGFSKDAEAEEDPLVMSIWKILSNHHEFHIISA
jgi:hypothetical protein